MIGTIATFRRDLGVGIILAENGMKYRFQRQEIINPRLSLQGEEVDFELAGRTPKSIIVLAGSAWSIFSGAQPTQLFAGAGESFASRLAA